MPSTLQSVIDGLFTERHGQPVADWIRDRRDLGESWRVIARELYQLTDGLVDLPAQTLHNWTDGYTPEPANGEAA